MLAPAAQQVVGVQQDVQAFGEEAVDQLRITAFAGIALARRFGCGQALLMQSLNPCEKRRRTVDRRQGLVFQLLQALAEEFFRTAEQLGFGHIHGNQVGLEFLDQFFQRCGDFGNRQNAGHIGAALQRVQGALQIIADRPRQFLRAIGQEAHQGIQVGFRLVAENLQQLRINQFLVVRAGQGSGHGDRRHWLNRAGSRRLAFGQGMGGGR